MSQDAKSKERQTNMPIQTQLPIDTELNEQAVEALREKLGRVPKATRDRLCEDLQYQAERAPLFEGERHALLVAVPAVLGYTRKTKLTGQNSLVCGPSSAMPGVLRDLWSGVVPGKKVAPLLSGLRLDLALAAQPSEINQCARAGASFLRRGTVGRHQWRADGAEPMEVMPPMPGVFLALAAVECMPGETLLAERNSLERSLREFATVIGAIFSTVQEVPSVTIGAPLPFYAATERAFSGQIRHIAGRAGPVSSLANSDPVQVDVLPVKRGQAARIVLSAHSEVGDDFGEPICSWESDWSWRTSDALVRASERAALGSMEDDYWVSVQGQALGGLQH